MFRDLYNKQKDDLIQSIIKFTSMFSRLKPLFIAFNNRIDNFRLHNNYYFLLLAIASVSSSFIFHYSFNQTNHNFLLIFQLSTANIFFLGVYHIVIQYFLKNEIKFEIAWFLLSYISFALYWLPQGLDVTDEGRIPLIAKHLNNSPLNNYVLLRYGSIYFSYLWNSIVDFEYLIWSRIGYVFSTSITGITIFLFLKPKFNNNYLTISLITGMVAFSILPIYTINYNVMPIMFLALAVYFNHKSSGSPILNQSIAFLTLALAVLCKFSTIIFIPIYIINLFFFYKNIKASRKQILIGLFIGISFFVILFLGSIELLNLEGQFISNLIHTSTDHASKPNSSTSADSHNIFLLLKFYWDDLNYVTPYIHSSALLLTVSVVISLFVPNFLRFALYGFLVYYFIYDTKLSEFFWNGILGILITVTTISTYFTIRLKKYRIALFWAISFLFGTFIGSNNGLVNIFLTGGVIMIIPVALGIIEEQSINAFGKSLRLNKISFCILFTLFFIGLFWHKNIVYRELPRTQLTNSFKSEKLIGLFSNSNRVKEIDNYLEFIETHLSKNETILQVNTIPMISFLSDKTANVVADCCGWLSITPSEIEYEYVLLNTKNSRNSNWPIVDNPCDKNEIPKYNQYLDFLSSEYSIIYQGEALVLYKKNS